MYERKRIRVDGALVDNYAIDPFHVCRNAAKLEDKTKEIFASVKQSYCSVLQIGCIPTDVQGVYSMFLSSVWIIATIYYSQAATNLIKLHQRPSGLNFNVFENCVSKWKLFSDEKAINQLCRTKVKYLSNVILPCKPF